MINDDLIWLMKWYGEQCNGDWEHDYGIKIDTLDNPGWDVVIETQNTRFVLPDKEWVFIENNANDWYGYKISAGIFEASGSPNRLVFLLKVFRKELSAIDFCFAPFNLPPEKD